MSRKSYISNQLVHEDRRLGKAKSQWMAQFQCEHIRPLIICRGPIRKEAIDIFSEMGIEHFGILISEKDSITYRNALAPELRMLKDFSRVHRVKDYTGLTKSERLERIEQIICITKEHDYNALFSGYGFMAEDADMVSAMEKANLMVIGPSSNVIQQAGFKDEAKRTALKVGVSVTPGIDNAAALALLKKHSNTKALLEVSDKNKLNIDRKIFEDTETKLEELAEIVLSASYEKGVDLYSIDELSQAISACIGSLSKKHPGYDIRLKAIGGGGGKGQRIVSSSDATKARELVTEILQEVKATGVGDNKNIIVELNVKATRHQEIQVIGNGDWCVTLGGRDCSIQMHEQKLLELSVTDETLIREIEELKTRGLAKEARLIQSELNSLRQMEEEAARFGSAVGLDSVSTFECIVSNSDHFFMEMNTRIQVEHRVSELCYGLKFINPSNPKDYFVCNSLVELMVLLAAHGKALPSPERVPRYPASVEARLNATNAALKPHAGGVVEYWSDPLDGEIRDDQGISLNNPDTGMFMKYHLAGAYDSNIALLLSVGSSRREAFENISEIFRKTRLRGENLSTNLHFHYGLINWLMSQNVNAQPTTEFVAPYLALVGQLKEIASQIDLEFAWNLIQKKLLDEEDDSNVPELTEILSVKKLLLLRPIALLLSDPHLLSGWLSLNRDSYTLIDGHISLNENPIDLIYRTYHFLAMDYSTQGAAAERIWREDYELLVEAKSFYEKLNVKLGSPCWIEFKSKLAANTRPKAIQSERLWRDIQSANKGFQTGSEILGVLIAVGEMACFGKLSVSSNLKISIPKKLMDKKHQEKMSKFLEPPPMESSNELLAQTGGMFYGRESPDHAPFLKSGDHFEEGDPLYIIEVMKMFNKVYASFSGTVEEVLIEQDGVIVSQGQRLFRIKPDFIAESKPIKDIASSQAVFTKKLLKYF